LTTNPCKEYGLILKPQQLQNYIFLSNDNSDHKPPSAVQTVLFLFIKVCEKNVLRKTLGSKRKDRGIMGNRGNVIMRCFMLLPLYQKLFA